MKLVRLFVPLFLAFAAVAGKPEPVEKLRADAVVQLEVFADRHSVLEAIKADPEGWDGAVMRFSRAVLRENPPQSGDPAIRKAALELLDFPLRIEDSDPKAPAGFGQRWRETVNAVYGPAFDAAINEFATAEVESGVRIWKLYNMAFLVRTRNHAWGFDLRSGDTITRRFTPEQLEKLAGTLNALFITHNHGDHVGSDLAAALLKAGKPVIRPTDETLKALGSDPNLRTLYGDPAPVEIAGLTVRAFPGEQYIPNQFTACNVYMVSADSVTVTHNGDNQSPAPYELLKNSGIAVDAAIANSWSGFAPYLAAAQPRIAVIGHEHELKHKVSGRDPFATVFKRIEKAKPSSPVFVIDCGESILCNQRNQQ